MNVFEMCAGISAFSVAASRIKNNPFNFIGSSEVDDYCNTHLLEQGMNICGDLNSVAIPESEHPFAEFIANNDAVPCEFNGGFTSFTMQDFLDGVCDWPDLLIAGFPCQTTSNANTQCNTGIKSGASSLIDDILEKIELLEPQYLIFENASTLNVSGLHDISLRLNALGYHVEYETISAAQFGYNSYRHRIFIIAYRSETKAYKSGKRVFDYVQHFACKKAGETFPLAKDHSEELVEKARVHNPKGNFRRHRIAALGNSIVVDICYSILMAIKNIEELDLSKPQLDFDFSNDVHQRVTEFGYNDKKDCITVPSRGFVSNGDFYTGEINRQLNPTNRTYADMSPTLIRNDYKNTFSTNSRSKRPGGLGGLTGFFIKEFGFDEGALNPAYCDLLMGFDENYTKLNSTKLLRSPFKFQKVA